MLFCLFVCFKSALLASRKHHLCLVVSVKFVERMRPEVMVFPLLHLGNSSQSLPASPGWIYMHVHFLHQRNCTKSLSLGDLEGWGQQGKYNKYCMFVSHMVIRLTFLTEQRCDSSWLICFSKIWGLRELRSYLQLFKYLFFLLSKIF